MREKLIKLIHYCTSCEECRDEDIADHIIASGFIEGLQNEAYDLGVDSALHNHFGLSWEDAAGLRKEVTRLQNATKWIPVTERLPEPFVDVLVFRNGKIAIDHHEENGWFAHDFQGRRATHWMPLPEPPKGE